MPTNVRCVKVASFIGVALAILAAVMPLVYKIANESSQPLVCYKCWATLSENDKLWDNVDCLADQQMLNGSTVETGICDPSEHYCGIYYHEKEDENGGGPKAIFVRGCQEDQFRPSLFIGNWPSVLYGTPTGHKVLDKDEEHNITHSYMAWAQSCSSPMCNDWDDYKRQWSWIEWVKKAYTLG